MNAEIIAVGSELLLGQINNTNAKFLSQQLADLGVNVFYHTVVGDNAGRLESAIKIAENRAELIIFTGGLGPTKDDLTKETIAKHLQTDLVMDDTALASIEEYFKRTNRPMTENNRKQALVLSGAKVLPNDYGMAPGMFYRKENKQYMLLPGPPKEMEPMFLKYGFSAIKSQAVEEAVISSRVLRFFGIGEAMLEAEIEDILDNQTNPTIAPLAGDHEVTLRLTAKHHNIDTAIQLLEEKEKEIMAIVGEYFYGFDDTSLFNELSKKLQEKNLTLSAAESLTGGMFQETFTSFPGAGGLLNGGVVCYTNEVKANVLHVKQETIKNDGVVSATCAKELAENVAKLMESDIGVSFTGVAGPDELEGNPVGTVYIGIYHDGEVRAEKLNLGGSRTSIRKRSSLYGAYFLLKSLA
ncbi:competence/damage-inducible protein A [Cytobacillus sp. FSL K6-0265]|uniref:competence/damage-inducible protein A n=1 Tax=Cytobacillus sp. FSL K6-0265 TaxID=2921448 RepID=UPI0030FC0F87